MGNYVNTKCLSFLIKKYNLKCFGIGAVDRRAASTIYRLLNKKDGNPTIEVLKKLAHIFLITVSQLIGEEPLGLNQVH